MELPPVLILAALTTVVLLVILLLLRGAGDLRSARARTRWAKRRLAKQLRSQGKAARAGELFLEAEEPALALETFLQGGLLARAAPLLEAEGDWVFALEAYESSGDHAAAARVAERLGEFAVAATHYEASQGWAAAARCWSEAGAHLRAGAAWVQAGEHLKSAQAYEIGGHPIEAAKVYRYLLDMSRAAAEGGGLQKTYDAVELGRRAGALFQGAGQMREAADAYFLGGALAEAAALYARDGALLEAAQVHMRLGDLASAAGLLERAGRPEQAAQVRARINMDAGNHRQAAIQFEAAGDLEAAAGLRMQVGDHAEAAGLYERAGNHLSAALAWGQAGQDLRAAQAWERAGDRAHAVELYRSSGASRQELRLRKESAEWVRVGELHLLLGELDEAEGALKAVRSEEPGFRDACRLMGEVYRLRGNMAAAAVRYRQSVEGTAPDSGSAEAFYWAAVCSLEADETRTSLSLLSALREYDPTFRDVQARLERCQRRVAEEVVKTGAADGRYEQEELLGEGGMGSVYRAHDVVLDREVAFKVLPPEATGHPQAREWFLREARSAAGLNHPNIVTVYDFGEVEGDLFIAMELVEGENLRERIKRDGPLPLERLRDVLAQACDALGYAHERGVIHRDIKPANLLWTPRNRLKITDFGLAKMTRLDDMVGAGTDDVSGYTGIVLLRRRKRAGDTTQSRIMGTPAYMSPEQIAQRRVSPAADLYSLGVTIFELATGELPFRGGNVLRAHTEKPPPSPMALRPDLPEWLERTVLRCLEKDPADRFVDAMSLRAAIPG